MRKARAAIFLSAVAVVFIVGGTLCAQTPTKPKVPYKAVVRSAPEIAWRDLSGAHRTTAAFLGRPVVVLIAPDANDKSFRRQVRRLRPSFNRLTASNAALLVAFSRSDDIRIPSDIPFIVAANGAKVDADFAANGQYRIAIIGRDGNLDYITSKVIPGQRVVDVIINSYASQAAERAKQVSQMAND